MRPEEERGSDRGDHPGRSVHGRIWQACRELPKRRHEREKHAPSDRLAVEASVHVELRIPEHRDHRFRPKVITDSGIPITHSGDRDH
jgi:hypothetical protein